MYPWKLLSPFSKRFSSPVYFFDLMEFDFDEIDSRYTESSGVSLLSMTTAQKSNFTAVERAIVDFLRLLNPAYSKP